MYIILNLIVIISIFAISLAVFLNHPLYGDISKLEQKDYFILSTPGIDLVKTFPDEKVNSNVIDKYLEIQLNKVPPPKNLPKKPF